MRLTVLGPVVRPEMEALVLEACGSGLRLRVPWMIPSGSPVKVDARDMLLLGEVTRCEPEGEAYVVGMQLSHSLEALAELHRLNRALLGEEAGSGAPEKARTRS